MSSSEHEKRQEKVYTKWCNSWLKHRFLSIEEGTLCRGALDDGKILWNLLSVLSGKTLPKLSNPKMRIHKLENIAVSLQFLADENIKLVGIGHSDILDQNVRLILGLIWTIILRFQISVGSNDVQRAKQELFDWVATKAPASNSAKEAQGVDGPRLITLVSTLLKDADINAEGPQLTGDLRTDIKRVLHQAEEKLGIAQIIDVDDVVGSDRDDKFIMTYLSQLKQAQKNIEQTGLGSLVTLSQAAAHAKFGPKTHPLSTIVFVDMTYAFQLQTINVHDPRAVHVTFAVGATGAKLDIPVSIKLEDSVLYASFVTPSYLASGAALELTVELGKEQQKRTLVNGFPIRLTIANRPKLVTSTDSIQLGSLFEAIVESLDNNKVFVHFDNEDSLPVDIQGNKLSFLPTKAGDAFFTVKDESGQVIDDLFTLHIVQAQEEDIQEDIQEEDIQVNIEEQIDEFVDVMEMVFALENIEQEAKEEIKEEEPIDPTPIECPPPAICMNSDLTLQITRPKKPIPLEFLKANIDIKDVVITATDARGNKTTLPLSSLSEDQSLISTTFTPTYDGRVSVAVSHRNGAPIDDSMSFTVGPFPIITIEPAKSWYEQGKPVCLKIRSNVNLSNRDDVSFTVENEKGKMPFKLQNNILSFNPPTTGSYFVNCCVDDSLLQDCQRSIKVRGGFPFIDPTPLAPISGMIGTPISIQIPTKDVTEDDLHIYLSQGSNNIKLIDFSVTDDILNIHFTPTQNGSQHITVGLIEQPDSAVTVSLEILSKSNIKLSSLPLKSHVGQLAVIGIEGELKGGKLECNVYDEIGNLVPSTLSDNSIHFVPHFPSTFRVECSLGGSLIQGCPAFITASPMLSTSIVDGDLCVDISTPLAPQDVFLAVTNPLNDEKLDLSQYLPSYTISKPTKDKLSVRFSPHRLANRRLQAKTCEFVHPELSFCVDLSRASSLQIFEKKDSVCFQQERFQWTAHLYNLPHDELKKIVSVSDPEGASVQLEFDCGPSSAVISFAPEYSGTYTLSILPNSFGILPRVLTVAATESPYFKLLTDSALFWPGSAIQVDVETNCDLDDLSVTAQDCFGRPLSCFGPIGRSPKLSINAKAAGKITLYPTFQTKPMAPLYFEATEPKFKFPDFVAVGSESMIQLEGHTDTLRLDVVLIGESGDSAPFQIYGDKILFTPIEEGRLRFSCSIHAYGQTRQQTTDLFVKSKSNPAIQFATPPPTIFESCPITIELEGHNIPSSSTLRASYQDNRSLQVETSPIPQSGKFFAQLFPSQHGTASITLAGSTPLSLTIQRRPFLQRLSVKEHCRVGEPYSARFKAYHFAEGDFEALRVTLDGELGIAVPKAFLNWEKDILDLSFTPNVKGHCSAQIYSEKHPFLTAFVALQVESPAFARVIAWPEEALAGRLVTIQITSNLLLHNDNSYHIEIRDADKHIISHQLYADPFVDLLEFRPTKEGPISIRFTVNDKPILSTPHTIHALPPFESLEDRKPLLKIVHEGCGHSLTLGDVFTTTIEVRGVPWDHVSLLVEDDCGQEQSCKMQRKADGNVRLDFFPKALGCYFLKGTLKNESRTPLLQPFVIEVKPKGIIRIQTASNNIIPRIARPYPLLFKTKHISPQEVRPIAVFQKNPTELKIQSQSEENGYLCFATSFTPLSAGDHLIRSSSNSFDVKPLLLKVYPAPYITVRSFPKHSLTKKVVTLTVESNVFANEDLVSVTVFDEDGRITPHSTISDPFLSSIQFVPSSPGCYRVEISMEGRPILCSPFHINTFGSYISVTDEIVSLVVQSSQFKGLSLSCHHPVTKAELKLREYQFEIADQEEDLQIKFNQQYFGNAILYGNFASNQTIELISAPSVTYDRNACFEAMEGQTFHVELTAHHLQAKDLRITGADILGKSLNLTVNEPSPGQINISGSADTSGLAMINITRRDGTPIQFEPLLIEIKSPPSLEFIHASSSPPRIYQNCTFMIQAVNTSFEQLSVSGTSPSGPIPTELERISNEIFEVRYSPTSEGPISFQPLINGQPMFESLHLQALEAAYAYPIFLPTHVQVDSSVSCFFDTNIKTLNDRAISISVKDNENTKIPFTFTDGKLEFTPKKLGQCHLECFINGKPILSPNPYVIEVSPPQENTYQKVMSVLLDKRIKKGDISIFCSDAYFGAELDHSPFFDDFSITEKENRILIQFTPKCVGMVTLDAVISGSDEIEDCVIRLLPRPHLAVVIEKNDDRPFSSASRRRYSYGDQAVVGKEYEIELDPQNIETDDLVYFMDNSDDHMQPLVAKLLPNGHILLHFTPPKLGQSKLRIQHENGTDIGFAPLPIHVSQNPTVQLVLLGAQARVGTPSVIHMKIAAGLDVGVLDVICVDNTGNEVKLNVLEAGGDTFVMSFVPLATGKTIFAPIYRGRPIPSPISVAVEGLPSEDPKKQLLVKQVTENARTKGFSDVSKPVSLLLQRSSHPSTPALTPVLTNVGLLLKMVPLGRKGGLALKASKKLGTSPKRFDSENPGLSLLSQAEQKMLMAVSPRLFSPKSARSWSSDSNEFPNPFPENLTKETHEPPKPPEPRLPVAALTRTDSFVAMGATPDEALILSHLSPRMFPKKPSQRPQLTSSLPAVPVVPIPQLATSLNLSDHYPVTPPSPAPRLPSPLNQSTNLPSNPDTSEESVPEEQLLSFLASRKPLFDLDESPRVPEPVEAPKPRNTYTPGKTRTRIRPKDVA